MTSYGSYSGIRRAQPVPAGNPALIEDGLKQPGFRGPRMPLTQKALTLVGLAVLTCLIALPVSDSGLLLNDFNYLFWLGQALPAATIISLVALVFIYFLWSGSMGKEGVEKMTIHDLASLVATFICTFGVILVLTSLYLYWNGYHVTSALMYNCAGSAVTTDVRQSYMGLLALRQTPACAAKFSIEECAGYSSAAAPVYAKYFLQLETDYRCSGFCYTPVQGNASLLEATGAEQGTASFLARASGLEQVAAAKDAAKRQGRTSTLPPALFSKNTYKTSCDGAATRNLQFMALQISHVWWMIGVVSIGLSAFVGFGEWFCCQVKMK